MPVGMTAARVAVTVVATVVTTTAVATAVITVFVVVLVTHVVTQCTTGTTTGSGADQAAGAATDTAAHHVAACRAERAADGCFATAVFVGTHRTTTRTAQCGTNGRAGIAAQRLTDD